MATSFHNRGGAAALPLNLIAQAIPRLSRSDLEDLTERLIGRLDEIDGEDCCAAVDDGCGPVWVDGRVRWGAEEESTLELRKSI